MSKSSKRKNLAVRRAQSGSGHQGSTQDLSGHIRTAQALPPAAELSQQPSVPPAPPKPQVSMAHEARPSFHAIMSLSQPPQPRQPDAGWRQWVAENLLRGCTTDSMLQTMTQAGLDSNACAAVISHTQQDPIFIAASGWVQIQKKYESVFDNYQRVLELSPSYGEVERRPCPSTEEFLERYVAGCRPAVFTNVAQDWPALQRWQPPLLKERFKDVEIEVQAGRNQDKKYEQNKLAHRQRVKFGEFVHQVMHQGVTNDYYLTANNELLRTPEFASLFDDIGSLPPFCDRTRLRELSWLWVGPAGTNTPLHHDTVMLLHTQLVGRKRWRFISPLATPRLYNSMDVFSPIDLDAPDINRYPAFKEVKVLEVVAGPGDTVFLPLAWWHQVSALEVSVSLSFTNLAVPNTYKFNNPNLPHW